MEILQEKCTNLQIQKQLKQNEMNFCKDIIYTIQNYDKNQYKKKKYKKYNLQNFKIYNKNGYFLRKSSARKPYLNRDRHVRKY